MTRETIFSQCRKYRYTLWRQWQLPQGLPYGGSNPVPLHAAGEYVQFIGLNPSTADEVQDDPTIRRCIRFAKDWGYAAMCMTNLFAFRATDPEVMRSHCTEENFEATLSQTNNLIQIRNIGREAGLIIAAWGTHGCHLNAGNFLKEFCFKEKLKLHHLGVNGDGSPKHPLYLRADTKPTLWT